MLKNKVVKRVFLIKPAYKESYYKYKDLSAGLGYVSQALDNHNIENTVFDMHLEKAQNLFKRIAEFSPELIGLSLMSYRFMKHYELIEGIKFRFPNIPIVVGGPHVSTFREKVLEKCSVIDFGIVLEGDEAIVELCQKIDEPKQVKGLFYRKEGKVVFTGERQFIGDLDALGFPHYSHFDVKKYDFITIITSRGCPFRCIYCPVIYTIGNKWRCRSSGSVGEELEYWYNLGFRRFEFGDDNFTLERSRVLKICDEIEQRGLKEIEIGLGNGIRADKVDKPLLMRMKEVGFSYVAFGVESASNRILQILKKGESVEAIEAGIKAACEVGFPVELFFLLGSPSETEDDVRKSVDLALKYPVKDVAFYNILPFPNTELYAQLLKDGAFVRDPELHLNDSSHWVHSPVFETPELSVEKRIRLLKWANDTSRNYTNRLSENIRFEKMRKFGLPYSLAFLMIKLGKIEILKWPLRKLGVLLKIKKVLKITY